MNIYFYAEPRRETPKPIVWDSGNLSQTQIPQTLTNIAPSSSSSLRIKRMPVSQGLMQQPQQQQQQPGSSISSFSMQSAQFGFMPQDFNQQMPQQSQFRMQSSQNLTQGLNLPSSSLGDQSNQSLNQIIQQRNGNARGLIRQPRPMIQNVNQQTMQMNQVQNQLPRAMTNTGRGGNMINPQAMRRGGGAAGQANRGRGGL